MKFSYNLIRVAIIIFVTFNCLNLNAQMEKIGSFAVNNPLYKKDSKGNLYAIITNKATYEKPKDYSYIVKYDNGEWKELGGEKSSTFSTTIIQLDIDASNNLYAVLKNGDIYKYNDTWTKMGDALTNNFGAFFPKIYCGINNGVYILTEKQEKGYSTTKVFGNLYNWDGKNWKKLNGNFEDGISCIITDANGNPNVYSIKSKEYQKKIEYNEGVDSKGFRNITRYHNYIAKWDGKSWSEVGDTLDIQKIQYSERFDYPIDFMTLDPLGNFYIVLGDTRTTDLNSIFYIIMKWDGKTWTKLGGRFKMDNSRIRIKADSKGNVYATNIQSINGTNNFMIWNGTDWTSLASIRDDYFFENIILDKDENVYVTKVDNNPIFTLLKYTSKK